MAGAHQLCGSQPARTNEKAAQNRISITIFSPLSQSINALACDYPWRVLKKRRPPNQAYSRPLAQPANMPEVSEQVKQAVNMRAPPRSRSIERTGRPRNLLRVYILGTGSSGSETSESLNLDLCASVFEASKWETELETEIH